MHHTQTTTRFVAIALSVAGAITACAPAPITAEFGVPFALRAGQSAQLGGVVRVTLTALMPEGKCPGGEHAECIAVSPPQAMVDVEANGTKARHLVFLLMGPNSAEQQAGNLKMRIIAVAPDPFTREDVSSGRASATLLVTPISTSGN